jgi:hypothetical protein
MVKYQAGDRVEKVRGSYDVNKYGTFNGKSGLAKCCVKIGKDSELEED